MKNINQKYLTEQKVGKYLRNRYGEESVISQYQVGKTRVDFFLKHVEFNFKTDTPFPNTNVFVEFDGNHHYQQKTTMNRDIKNQIKLLNDGFHIIHIPYFVQADFVFSFYFNTTTPEDFYKDVEIYPHGFVDKKCIRPIDFSFDGWKRFIYEYYSYPTPIRDEIYWTLTKNEISIFNEMQKYRKDIDDMYDSISWISYCMVE